MRILVHEFVSGGGLAGRDVPPSLAREGRAMLTALITDLAATDHQIITTADPRFPIRVPSSVDVVTLLPGRGRWLDTLIASADAVWLIAPETDRCLERLAARTERMGKPLLGPGSATIRQASDKASLSRRLTQRGVAHPMTRVMRRGARSDIVARELGYPVVVKPARGTGSIGVCLARDAAELRRAVVVARRASRNGPLLVQRYIRGAAASVSLLADGRRAVALAVNAQFVRAARPFTYRGGQTPFDHPLAARAIEAALEACQAFPGLRGYVGVDLVLTKSDALVIEVNPRLTTGYVGVRSALDANVADLAVWACAGTLGSPPPVRRQVRFTAGGRIVSTAPYSSTRLAS